MHLLPLPNRKRENSEAQVKREKYSDSAIIAGLKAEFNKHRVVAHHLEKKK
jgi:hypothetical protein